MRAIASNPPGRNLAAVSTTSGGSLVKNFAGLGLAVFDLEAQSVKQMLAAATTNFAVPNRELIATALQVVIADAPIDSHLRTTTGAADLVTATALSGSGITIAVIDSGVFPHADLVSCL